ncbi:helix-turn-helix transcriptional regulator [Paenibacillus marchantiae]|uniref:helix-turn-helix domain-containing protein n=1 Tax=Paenibacillus marchantiae TaxID=3026433 RepID=UPI00237A286A|nr:helix-turn-helix transcriptional regulator [Paenibacillus marchantiae]WDQ33627.1 helix-turn-helix transcriptional regulator [Paenibacillus marchantiae]
MTKLRNSVGERIRAIRKAKGLTQQQLAELSGLDDAYIGSVERGERNFSIDTLEKIVGGLDISFSDLLLIYNDEDQQQDTVRRDATVEYISILSELDSEQIKTLRKILDTLKGAFD